MTSGPAAKIAGAAKILPDDAADALLIGRVWADGNPAGPAVAVIRDGEALNITRAYSTVSALLDTPDPAAAAREAAAGARPLGRADELAAQGRLLAPCDLQAVKAAGVTFAASLLERVVEEQARGDPAAAGAIRERISAAIGVDLSQIRPGSPEAARLKDLLVEQGVWSQYLEVGIGPDAEIFTKCQPMSALGCGATLGLHRMSSWNNPEPELVLAVNSRGEIVGAALGNDVNLRDVEGRSALLLGKAKDNNGSTAIGPFIRLIDAGFTLDDMATATISLRVEGTDGFVMTGESSLSQISRGLPDLAGQMLGAHHQYPDGAMLFTGTMFAPVDDRDAPGRGFTHHDGDVVEIASPRLGRLINRMSYSDAIAPWTFGTRALMENLAARGLL